MPKLYNRPPRLSLHKASGRACLRLAGRTIYLAAPYGSKACRAEYDRVVAEWLAGGRALRREDEAGLTVAELVEKFLEHADGYYRRPDGSPTGEADNFRDVLGPIVRLYALTPAAAFGPLQLRAVRDEMIRRGWCRTYTNRAVGRVRQVFKWAASFGHVPVGAHQGLTTVEPLGRGRSPAREPAPVGPVDLGRVEATLPHMPPVVATMVRLQLLTGMRSGEVCAMTTGAIDRSGEDWTYTPASHKTAHHGKARTIRLLAPARELLTPWLKDDPDAPLFSPAEAVATVRARRSQERRTPPSQGNGPGTHVVRRRKPRREPGDRYDSHAYALAVARACDAAFTPPALKVPRGVKCSREERAKLRAARAEWVRLHRREYRWHPHQLRHAFATLAAGLVGYEPTRAALGHSTVSTTALYARRNTEASDLALHSVGAALAERPGLLGSPRGEGERV